MLNLFRNCILNITALGTLLALSALQSPAAEIRLKSSPIFADSLVLLSDIADILPTGNEDVGQLGQWVLFPAPAEGTERTLEQWEVRSMLSQLGVNMLHHFVSGASKIQIIGASGFVGLNPAGTTPAGIGLLDSLGPNAQFVVQANYLAPTPNAGNESQNTEALRQHSSQLQTTISDAMALEIGGQLESQIADALNVYLNYTNQIDRSWDISLKLTPDQIRAFATSGQIADIAGGHLPFTGQQQFTIRMQNGFSVPVNAVVALSTEIVVVRRALPRGYIIRESDVMLQKADKIRGEDFIVDSRSVVGMETVKAVREFTPLKQSDIRQPLWVRKGEIVTVKAVNGGITVRTEATAMQDGVAGDTITVAKIDLTQKRGRKEETVSYLARVCAPKTVEVFVK